ncbi:MAG: metabolite traffic protein EboE [Actinomycetota bacterium]|nr:metabolite traffic protein EboE [Actinomycetota bacterium]
MTRFRHPGGRTVHLSYCSNVHQAEDVAGIVAQLERFTAPVRAALGWPRLGLGLWLSAAAVAELRDERRLDLLRGALDAHRIDVVTLNGFPYQAFHAPVVKHAVYRPDWSEPARLEHTLELARLLHALLPDDADEGSISTLPLGWRDPWPTERAERAREALGRLAEGLADLADDGGRPVRVALEPEPGCTVETVAQALDVLDDIAPQWVGICVDACHLAVQFEDAGGAVRGALDRGVPIVKCQISSALRVPDPRQRDGVAAFAEPRFLHQTRERVDGRVVGVDDLDDALDGALPGASEWRVHFHVPVHAGGANTTQPELVATLGALVGGPTPATTHLEVETYTWSVLPDGQRPGDDAGVVDGLARELRWTRDRLVELGLREDM